MGGSAGKIIGANTFGVFGALAGSVFDDTKSAQKAQKKAQKAQNALLEEQRKILQEQQDDALAKRKEQIDQQREQIVSGNYKTNKTTTTGISTSIRGTLG